MYLYGGSVDLFWRPLAVRGLLCGGASQKVLFMCLWFVAFAGGAGGIGSRSRQKSKTQEGGRPSVISMAYHIPEALALVTCGRFRVLGSPPAPLLGHPWNLV
jgi:hypothetical protein